MFDALDYSQAAEQAYTEHLEWPVVGRSLSFDQVLFYPDDDIEPVDGEPFFLF